MHRHFGVFIKIVSALVSANICLLEFVCAILITFRLGLLISGGRTNVVASENCNLTPTVCRPDVKVLGPRSLSHL